MKRRMRDEVFVVRIWTERDLFAKGTWRASVTHVASRESRLFTNYGELCEFLERYNLRVS
ncbi:MAG: hypothetical protein JO199_08280 [Candidatus Eremiobacteraeota bacterium]|nr:hypothetical protein [Candidatus Eremiobacteraeota bacterium]